MNDELLLSMSAFALAASVSPGPVNLLALRSGTCYGFRRSLSHVTGATAGFTLLLILTGFGLHRVLTWLPWLSKLIQYAGVAFLLYLALQLLRDDGRLDADSAADHPSLLRGAAMQWLNPKAWLASVAGMGAYVSGGESVLIWQFALIYFVICFLSVALWAYAGSVLRTLQLQASRMRLLNRVLAALLLLSAAALLFS